MLAKDIMRTRFVSVSQDTGVPEVAELMLREHFSTVPVLEDGALVGIVNEVHLMRRLNARGIRRVPVVKAGKLIGSIGRADLVRALAAASARSRRIDPQSDPQSDPPIDAPMDDESIHRALRSELESQPWCYPAQSRFDVRAGVVHFQGRVESAEAARAARVAAENLPGVSGVVEHRLDASATHRGGW